MTRSRTTDDLPARSRNINQSFQRQRKRTTYPLQVIRLSRYKMSSIAWPVAVVWSSGRRVWVETAVDDLVSIFQVSISQGNG